MANELQKFEQFMDKFRINDTKQCITHTSMINIYKKKGSFHISQENNQEFLDKYKKIVFEHGYELGITERGHPEKGMLKLDFDFKYESDNTNRLYNEEIILIIVSIIQNILVEYVEEQPKNDIYNAYIFQRPNPYIKDKFVKDGLHIMYPNLSLKYQFHHFIRSQLIEGLEKIKLCNHIPFINELSDVVDESVIDRNGWLMYGSSKLGIAPYKLIMILDQNCQKVINTKSDFELVNFLSIRKHIPEAKIIKDYLYEENRKKKRKTEKIELESDNIIFPDKSKDSLNLNYELNSEILYIEKLCGLLDYGRCMDYPKWLEVGLCLNNISNELFYLWFSFSTQNFNTIIDRINTQYDREYKLYQECKTDDLKVKLYEQELIDWEDIINHKKDLLKIQNDIQEKYITNSDNFYKDCKDRWDSFKKKEDGLNIGSLVYWAKKDNPKQFKKMKFASLRLEIESCILNPSHAKIAKILQFKYKDLYKCSDYESTIWYVWEEHYWKRMDGVSTIRRKITGSYYDNDSILNDFKQIKNIVFNEKIENNINYIELKAEVEKLEYQLEPTREKLVDFKRKFGQTAVIPGIACSAKVLTSSLKEKKLEMDKLRKELEKLYVKPYNDTIQKFLETSNAIDNITKEAKQEFYDKDFNRKLNSNPNLFLFGNGVFDLENMNFRDGRPDDYISLESDEPQIKYSTFDLENDPIIKEIEEFFEKVLVDPLKRNYFLLLIASCLEGLNTNQIFAILTGNGSNSKSLTMNFIEDCFGTKYSGKLNPSFITQKRNKSSSASPEYYGIVDCRIVSSEEIDNSDELNTAIIKEITGNSKISSRTLYQSKMTTKIPQFTPFLICNDLPSIKSMDGGTWRRLVVISFDSKFVDDPSDPKYAHLTNVFKIDRNLKQKMSNWKEPFMYLLIHKYYKNYLENNKNLIAPECVKAFTDKFKDENDFLQPFIETNIVNGSKNDTIKLKELYNRVILWFREHYQGEKEPSQQTIKKYFETKYGQYDSKGWCGKKLVDN
jgi:P4 family phage/plasmid primase-like protien